MERTLFQSSLRSPWAIFHRPFGAQKRSVISETSEGRTGAARERAGSRSVRNAALRAAVSLANRHGW